MAVVGVDYRNGRAHAAFVELLDVGGKLQARVQRAHDFDAESWDHAVQHAVDLYGAWPLAVAVDVPDCRINEVKPRVDMNAREMQDHARLRAEEAGFERGDDVRVFEQDGRWFFAAMRRATLREIRNAARKVKAPAVAWVEYRPNALMRRVDPGVHAVADMNERRLYVRGEYYSIGVDLEEPDGGAIAHEISGNITEAESSGFTGVAIRRLGVVGALDRLTGSGVRFAVEPYELDLRAEWTDARGAIATATTALMQGAA
jgi:hypothetical protein